MADQMTYPNNLMDFIREYSFRDKEEIYTNGAELVPVFRVEQMIEYYIPHRIHKHTNENCHNITCKRERYDEDWYDAIDKLSEKLIVKIREVYSAPEVESEYNYGWKTACKIIESNLNFITEEMKGNTNE